jgi:hypothetical protein
VLQRWTDPVQGERTRALVIGPPATIDAVASVQLFPNNERRTLRAVVRASAGAVSGTATIKLPAHYSVEPRSIPFKLDAAGSEAELEFEIKPDKSAEPADATLAVEVAGERYDRGLRVVEYPHIPIQVWHPLARVRLVPVELKLAGKHIGYLPGAGDDVAPILAQAGYSVTPLDEAALRERDLSGFDAIVLGVRAFNVHPWLSALKGRLFAYVEQGGALVVQYNVKNWNQKVPEQLGPWPFGISRDRVTDETAEVIFADPQSAILRSPNLIGPGDFKGWVQERGLYFAEHWDERYEAPLAMHDPNEEELRGSLLLGKVGKGRFVYTGLSFFRQLPAGVPGAVRLFANLLSKDGNAF